MGRKCVIAGCHAGHTSIVNDFNVEEGQAKLSIFPFPNDVDERLKWISALPIEYRLEEVTVFMGVCEKHWRGWRDGTTPRLQCGNEFFPVVPPDNFDPLWPLPF